MPMQSGYAFYIDYLYGLIGRKNTTFSAFPVTHCS
jgi:hypothetical protein